jgi:hypothetical protein
MATTIKMAGLALLLIPLLYMGAYYATITMNARGGCIAFPTYKLGDKLLPEWTDDFFAPANWIDDQVHLAPCKRPKFYTVPLPLPLPR